ncbi:serine/threonine protein kinase [Kribbella steppae]|uniref:Serine/threonine protein kinase n=1 Tax=Kribbella steppae TaxID=2512223 RepID=A0A4R2HVE9_9ACTN|nr:serine/threonine protein kinase [Kribbella steppae]
MALEDIAGYSLRRKLGSGSAGTVWLVRDRASGRNAVLKRVPMTAISHPNELREDLTVLQRIDHPHVARLREVRETGTEWLLFSQYVVAGTLTALLSRRGPLTDGELVTLLSPLAAAIDYLHHAGLTHGRVTPANIMFDADGRPVLTDAVLHTARPATPTDDLTSLPAVAHQSGGDPSIFTPNLFTTTRPHDLLTLTTPIPINLAFTQDPTPTDDSTSTNSTTPPPRPRPTTKPPTTDDPIHRARDPLAPPPKKPSSPHPSQPTPPQPPPPKPTPGSTKRARRKPRLPNLTRRTRPTPTPINPLSRLAPPATTPLTPDPTTTPAHTPALDPAFRLGVAGASLGDVPDQAVAEPAHTPVPPELAAAPILDAFHPASDADHPATSAGDPTSSAATSTSVAWGDGAAGFVRPPGRSSRTALRRRRTWRRRYARWRRFMRSVHGPGSRMALSRAGGLGSVPRASGSASGTSGSAVQMSGSTSGTSGSALAASGPASGTRGSRRFGFRQSAYGVLAAVGVGAVVVLIFGLLTVGVLDNPAGTAAVADRTEQSPAQSPGPARPTRSLSPTTPTRSPSPTTPNARATTSRPTAPAQPSRVDAGEWTRTLEALDTQRAQAFWTLDLALLDAIYVPGTEPWEADRALLTTYRKHQIRVRGLQIRIDKTTIESQTPSTVVLRTVDHLTGGQAIDPSGTTATLPAGAPATRRITLTSTPTTQRSTTSAWRIAAITSA